MIPESDFSINRVEVMIEVPRDGAVGDPTAACTASAPSTGTGHECGWTVEGGMHGCTLGAIVEVSCGASRVAGPCAGEPDASHLVRPRALWRAHRAHCQR